jgi:hypothetical protein
MLRRGDAGMADRGSVQRRPPPVPGGGAASELHAKAFRANFRAKGVRRVPGVFELRRCLPGKHLSSSLSAHRSVRRGRQLMSSSTSFSSC